MRDADLVARLRARADDAEENVGVLGEKFDETWSAEDRQVALANIALDRKAAAALEVALKDAHDFACGYRELRDRLLAPPFSDRGDVSLKERGAKMSAEELERALLTHGLQKAPQE